VELRVQRAASQRPFLRLRVSALLSAAERLESAPRNGGRSPWRAFLQCTALLPVAQRRVPSGGRRAASSSSKLCALVEGARGALWWQPFVWDGKNSEVSRRQAGTALLERALEFERAAEPYCIIGHSHGGSVIELFQAAARGNPLPNLKQWITVGTPFVVRRRRFFLFSRLNAFGKAVYLAWMMAVLTALTLLVLSLTHNATHIPEGIYAVVQLVGSLALFIASIIFYAVLRRFEKRNPIRRKGKIIGSARALFAEPWTSLWHKHDEAMQGLAALKSIRVGIFPRDYSVEPLSLAAVFLLPAIAALLLASPSWRTSSWFFVKGVGAELGPKIAKLLGGSHLLHFTGIVIRRRARHRCRAARPHRQSVVVRPEPGDRRATTCLER